MKFVELIRKKRDGNNYNKEEIEYIIKEITKGHIADYQIASWLMAVFLKGMNEDEITELTHQMSVSGEILDLSSIKGIKVDKHSTGGVGDKVTLVLAPLVAACGAVMAKLSGRGLGHTGGTIDKLEAIPGFRTSLSVDEFIDQLKEIGVAVAGQTQNLAPADGVLYALRDVTGTVDSIPLIVSSVLSKKIAAGTDVIVLDVKYGSGAFMQTFEQAKELATYLVNVGKKLNKYVSVVLSDMDQPLGKGIGHTLEVKEAIETLQGKGPADLTEICLTLGSILLKGAKICETFDEGKELLKQKINNGEAIAKFRELIKQQKGNPDVIEKPELMPTAENIVAVKSDNKGYIKHMDALKVGYACKMLGGGREKKGDPIDLGVGVVLNCKRGDYLEKGQDIAFLHANDMENIEKAKDLIKQSISYSDTAPESMPLIKEIIVP